MQYELNFEEAEFTQNQYDDFISTLKSLNQEDGNASQATQTTMSSQCDSPNESTEKCDSAPNIQLAEFEPVKLSWSPRMSHHITSNQDTKNEFYKNRAQMYRDLKSRSSKHRNVDPKQIVKEAVTPCILELVGEDIYMQIIDKFIN